MWDRHFHKGGDASYMLFRAQIILFVVGCKENTSNPFRGCEDRWARNRQKRRIQPSWVIYCSDPHIVFMAKRVYSPELLMMLQVVCWSFLSSALLQKKLQQPTNCPAHGSATSSSLCITLSAWIIQMAWQAEFKVKVCFGCEQEQKIPACRSGLATQLCPPCCHRCLTNRSIRGYEKSPHFY